jgi:hypothetical protein
MLIFNRPAETARVFREIASARPPRLLVVADGPRPDYPDDPTRCTEARAVIEQVDWPCEVLTNYAETNMGLRHRVASGLDWAFSLADELIVLEDDCVPHPTFFRFCDELLAHYRHDTRIMAISGENSQLGHRRNEYSYYFSRYNHCWGWASWRRAWNYFDMDMKLWPEIRDGNWLSDLLDDPVEVSYWKTIFQKNYENKINSWAYRWTFACWVQSGLSILPNVNMISNIGYGVEGTHTTGYSWIAQMPTEAVEFPLHHPPFVIRDTQADTFSDRNRFSGSRSRLRSLLVRIKGKLVYEHGRFGQNMRMFYRKRLRKYFSKKNLPS